MEEVLNSYSVQGDKPKALESLHMGCVLMTERYFGGGRITKENMDVARTGGASETATSESILS